MGMGIMVKGRRGRWTMSRVEDASTTSEALELSAGGTGFAL